MGDADLTVEDFLVGLPVLWNLGVDTKTLLKDCCNLLDGTNCAKPNQTVVIAKKDESADLSLPALATSLTLLSSTKMKYHLESRKSRDRIREMHTQEKSSFTKYMMKKNRLKMDLVLMLLK